MIEMTAPAGHTLLETTLERIDKLGRSSIESGFAELFEFLDSSDWQLRRAASEAMSASLKSNSEAVVAQFAFEALIDAVGEKDRAGRRAAAIAVLEMAGDAAIPFLAVAMKSAPDTARIALSGIVGATGGSRSVRLLKPLANVKSDSNVAAAAITALGRTNHSSAMAVLGEHVNSNNEWLQFAAVGALGELGDQRAIDLIEPLLDQLLLQETAALALVEIGTIRCVDILSNHCFSLNGRINEPVLNALSTLFNSERILPGKFVKAVRDRIRFKFHAAARERTVVDLLTMLRSASSERARCALAALGWLGRPEAVPEIIKALSDPALTKAARRSLADLAMHSSALEAMTDAVKAGTAMSEIAGAIQYVDSIDAIEPAVEILVSSTDLEARELCFGILSAIRARLDVASGDRVNSQAISRIKEVLLHALEKTQGRALSEIALTIAAIPSRRSHDVHKRVLEYLSKTDDPEYVVARLYFLDKFDATAAISAASIAQRHSSAAVRLCSIELLSGKDALNDVSSMAQHATDESAGVRRAAIRAMSQGAPTPEALRVLRAAATESDVWVRSEAIRTIGHVFPDTPEAESELLPALSNPHPLCRLSAIKALSEFSYLSQSSGESEELSDKTQTTWDKLQRLAEDDVQSEVRRAAVLAFINCPSASMARRVALNALKDDSWPVQLAAVELASKSRAEFAPGFLGSVAVDKTRNPAVRGAAIRSMASSGHPRSAVLACEALGSDDSNLVEDGYAALSEIARTNPDILRTSVANSQPRVATIVNFILESEQKEGA